MKHLLRHRFASPSLLVLASCSLLLVGCEANFSGPLETQAPVTLEVKNALRVLPPNAAFVGMADLAELTENGVFGNEQLPSLRSADSEAAMRLRNFFDATGFDPKEDVREVYVASSPGGASQMVLYATFDRARFTEYVENQLTDVFEGTAYAGTTIYHHAAEGSKGPSFALVNDDMILAAASPEGVRAMIDRLRGQGRALGDNAVATRLIYDVRGRGNAWFVLRNVPGRATATEEEAAGDEPGQRLERAVQDVAVAVQFSPAQVDVRALLIPQKGVRTADLADLVEGVIAAMKATDLDPDERRLLNNVHVHDEDDHVLVMFSAERSTLKKIR